MTCPSGVSWSDANISRDTGEGDAAVFSIDDQLSKDQCLFIRVNTQHDSNITYGKPQLSAVGFLKDPSGLSVSTDNVTHKATISATNNSDVEDSILVVRYVPSSGDPIDIGVIPHNSSSVTVQCPDWDDQEAIAFDVYAMVGTATKQDREDGVDSYSIDAKMRSQNTITQGGAVPVAPKNVAVNRVEGKPDTVRVDWDWPWSEAGSAEISWSDHDDAWESTDEPESFLISNLHAAHWNISGLETGKTWYVRVRLIAGNMTDSEDVTYGPWSDISQGTIDLSSAPNKPTLLLSNSVIPEDGSTIASWVYTTTDNTAQAYAEVAIVENGEYTPIAHSLTSQHVTIPAQSENYTLSTGNIYNLVCRVKSASGKLSEWSDIVSLTVAEPITCEITQTSLIHDHRETNPREFEGEGSVEFETEVSEDFAKLQLSLEPQQDLHGYDKPWVGGVGANLLNSDYAIKFTLSKTITFPQTILSGTKVYVHSDEFNYTTPPSSGNKYPYYVFRGANNENCGQVWGLQDTSVTLSGDAVAIELWSNGYDYGASSGIEVTISGLIISKTEQTTYSPYENICPISGYDEVSANVVGKNLFGGQYNTRFNVFIPANTAFTASAKHTGGSARIDYFDVDGNRIDWFGLTSGSERDTRTITSTEDVYAVSFTGTEATEYQIELGSTATDYEPYQGQTYTADLPQTVYGGTVDLVSGEVVIDRAMVLIKNLTWVRNTTSYPATPYFYATISGGIGGEAKQPLLLSSAYRTGSNLYERADGIITNANYHVANTLEINVFDSQHASISLSNFLEEMGDEQIVYPLATPQTIQLTPQEIQTLVGENRIWCEDEEQHIEIRIAESLWDGDVLTKMPLEITVSGAGEGGITSILVERAEDYLMERPDETNFHGNRGEVVLQTSPPLIGTNQVSFDVKDLIGPMDDGAAYNIVATVQDGLGQTDDAILPFEVHWAHQAEEPSAEIEIDEENLIAFITPIAPENADPEDVADIYRLSADRPELIVEGAEFGETYVDPYPALGDMGGHRIVTRTKNGDYITEDNQFAMVDSPELGVNPIENEDLLNIIDFEGRQIQFYWETDYSNTWAKDFQETQYLGGSIEGDWNPAVSRSGTLSSKAITVLDQEMLKDVRRLADYPGICHVRTADGSSYAADVQVSEDYTDDEKGMVTNYSLSITKVDPQGFEGMTKDQWDEENPPEEEEEP